MSSTPTEQNANSSQSPSTHSTPTHCITFQDVLTASKRIQSIIHKTPVLYSSSINALCDHQNLFFKVEAMQRTGSFKFRGACNATLNEVEVIRHRKQQQQEGDYTNSSDEERIHIVTHSSGNHAAAVALAAKEVSKLLEKQQHDGTTEHNKTNDANCQYEKKIKIESTIVMPRNAPMIKVNGVKGFGGNIVAVDNTNEAREEMADIIVERENATFIHPSENQCVIAGQGTVCLEMVDQVREIIMQNNLRDGGGDNNNFSTELDAVIIPVGGGGLAAGNTISLRGMLRDRVKIILAEPAEMDDAKRSREAGKLLGHHEDNQLKSCADGLKTTLGPNTWPIVRDLVDDIITVSEVEILRATKLIWERLKVAIEPSAGVGVAVALGEEFRKKYSVANGVKNVGIVLCGGNVDIIKICKLMEDNGINL